jgi:hypothetical protein
MYSASSDHSFTVITIPLLFFLGPKNKFLYLIRPAVKHSREIIVFCLIPTFLGAGVNKGKASSEINGIAEPTEMKNRNFRAGFHERCTELAGAGLHLC